MDADERGSIVRVSNNAGGTMRINSYDEYGVPGANNLGRFGYTGHVWLPEAGMYYARNRMYEPKLGRFMQTDPIGYDDGMNIYAYVRNDPINAVDPFGLSTSVQPVQPVQPKSEDPDPEIVVSKRYDPCEGVAFCKTSLTDIDLSQYPTIRLPIQFFSPCLEGKDCRSDYMPPPTLKLCPPPPASRNYDIPQGYTSAGDSQNRFVADGSGRSVKNPAYQTALNAAGGTNTRGVLTDLGGIALGVFMGVRTAITTTLRAYGLVASNGAKAGYEVYTTKTKCN